jgi:predicted nuclease of predicted toxin-antitoxin system
MKILLDANISWKSAKQLAPIFGECAHVDNIGLNVPAEDIDIWNYAHDNGYIILSKDNDFVDILERNDFPPKVIYLKIGNSSNKELIELLINAKQIIEEFEKNNNGLLEIVK